MPNIDLTNLLSAIAKGAPFNDEVCRVYHGRGDSQGETNFINLDWYPPYLFLACYNPIDEATQNALTEAVWQAQQAAGFDAKGLVFQYRAGRDTQVSVPFGEVQDRFEVAELGAKYWVQLTKTQNTGIFPDMREGRAFVKNNSHDAKVLNLFSYTCAFSVIAKLGGAQQVINMDMNKSVLRTGADNHRLNNVAENISYLPHDIFKSFGKLKKAAPFDLIVVDPPSFQKGSFVLTKDYQKILRRLPDLCHSNTQLLLCANSPDISENQFIEMISDATEGRLSFVERLPAAPRFEEPDGANLKALVYRLA